MKQLRDVLKKMRETAVTVNMSIPCAACVSGGGTTLIDKGFQAYSKITLILHRTRAEVLW